MNIGISRRQFAAMVAAIPAGLAAGSNAGFALQSLEARIGAKQPAFDAIFGEPRIDGWFTVYDFGDEGKASYWIAWDANDYAHRIANDYSAIPGGGLPFEPGLMGQSQFLPQDAHINAAGTMSDLMIGERGFYIAQHHSDVVRSETGRSGNILVVDERMIPGDGPNNPDFLATSIAMEAFEVNPVVPTGTLSGIGADYWQLEAEFGEIVVHQRGYLLATPPLPGRWMLNEQAVDILLDQPIPVHDAVSWINAFLPGDLPEMATTYWLPAAGDETGLRVCLWLHDNGMNTVALQVVHGGEEDGSVSRFVLSTIAPATV